MKYNYIASEILFGARSKPIFFLVKYCSFEALNVPQQVSEQYRTNFFLHRCYYNLKVS